MTATNHVATGVLIAVVVPDPWVALPLAFASHFVCDALPHFDMQLPIKSRKFANFFRRYGICCTYFVKHCNS